MLLGLTFPFQESSLVFSNRIFSTLHHLQETVEAEGGGGCQGEQEQGGQAPGDQGRGTAREQGGVGEEQQPAPSLLPHTLQAPNTKPNLPKSSCIHCPATLLLHLLLISNFYLTGTGDAYFHFSVSTFVLLLTSNVFLQVSLQSPGVLQLLQLLETDPEILLSELKTQPVNQQ